MSPPPPTSRYLEFSPLLPFHRHITLVDLVTGDATIELRYPPRRPFRAGSVILWDLNLALSITRLSPRIWTLRDPHAKPVARAHLSRHRPALVLTLTAAPARWEAVRARGRRWQLRRLPDPDIPCAQPAPDSVADLAPVARLGRTLALDVQDGVPPELIALWMWLLAARACDHHVLWACTAEPRK